MMKKGETILVDDIRNERIAFTVDLFKGIKMVLKGKDFFVIREELTVGSYLLLYKQRPSHCMHCHQAVINIPFTDKAVCDICRKTINEFKEHFKS